MQASTPEMQAAKETATLTAIAMLQNSMHAFMEMGREMLEHDEDENLFTFYMASGVKEDHHRIKRYIEDTVHNYSDKEFQSHFRLYVETYEALENKLGPCLNAGPRQKIEVRKQLLSVLWLLATPESFRSVADRFDLSKSSLHHCFVDVVNELNKIASQVISWPSEERKNEAKRAFVRFGGMREYIGAIDGTFVEITAPKEYPHVYTCRKAFYAMQLQVVALPNLTLTDTFTGYPGSVGDRRVFQNSPLYKKIIQDKDLYFTEQEYILGDKAYPILNWCVPPFINRGQMTSAQINFNTIHAKTRQVVERAFALFFGRYRRMKYLDMAMTNFIPKTILACCVLHNLCLEKDEINFREEVPMVPSFVYSNQHIICIK